MKAKRSRTFPTILRSIFQGYPGRAGGSARIVDLRRRVQSEVFSEVTRTGCAAQSLTTLLKYPSLLRLLQGVVCPASSAQIEQVTPLKFESLQVALEYTALALIPSIPLLQRFEHFRQIGLGEDSTLAAEHDEDGFGLGFSSWLAGERVAKYPSGSEQQIDYVNRIQEESRDSISSLAIFAIYGLRSGSKSLSDVGRYIRDLRLPPIYSAFLMVFLHPAPSLSTQECIAALQAVSGSPAIDRWFVLLRCIISLYADELVDSEALTKLVALRSLLASIQCHESVNLLSKIWGYESGIFSESPSTMEQEIIVLTSGNPESIEDPLTKQVMKALLNLANATPDWDGTIALLERHAIMWTGIRLGGVLASIVAQLKSFTERDAKRWYRYFSVVAHPKLMEAFPQGNVARQIRLHGVPLESRQHQIRVLECASRGETQEVLTRANSSLASLSHEELAIALDAYIEKKDVRAAVACAAYVISNEHTLVRRLPFRSISQLVPDEQADSSGDSVLRCLILDSCVKNGIVSDVGRRNDCFDDFLTLFKAKLPSETILSMADGLIDRNVLVHFLEKVCTQSVMDSVPIGRSTEELQQERIRILNHLRALNPPRGKHYESEMTDIAMVITARKELATLNQQRVFVDVDGLKSQLVNTLSDDYERYVRFRMLDSRQSKSSNILRHIREMFPRTTVIEMDELSREFSLESDRALLKLVISIRDTFADSPEFGLDGYLSGGIRHGNLEALLREPLAKKGLLGTFGENGMFAAPSYFEPILLLEQQNSGAALDCFREFAVNFQRLANEVVNEWVQVTTSSSNSRALFDLSLLEKDFIYVRALTVNCESIDDFISVLIAYLWKRVDRCLAEARDRMRGDLRTRIFGILTNLESGLKAQFSPDICRIIDNQLAPTRGGIDSAIDRLCEWFSRADGEGSGYVELALPFEVAARAVKDMFPSLRFNWSVEIAAPSPTISRRFVKHWVDMIQTLYFNAAQHSGCEDECKIEATCALSRTGGYLQVVNGLGSAVDCADVDHDLTRDCCARCDERV